MRSKALLPVVVAVFAAIPAVAQTGFHPATDDGWCQEKDGNHKARHCEVREATLPVSGLLTVDSSPNGGIDVRGSDGSTIRVLARVNATGDSEAEARELAKQVRIETDGTVRAVGPRHSGENGWSVSYRLFVPQAAKLRLQAMNGGLHVRDFVGAVEMHTVNGGIHLDGSGGHVTGDTVNGGIHLALAGHEWKGEGVNLRTTNGGVHVEVPHDYNARIEASTVNGGVHGLDTPTSHDHRRGGRIETDLGHGGSLIHIETTNGGLHIDRP